MSTPVGPRMVTVFVRRLVAGSWLTVIDSPNGMAVSWTMTLPWLVSHTMTCPGHAMTGEFDVFARRVRGRSDHGRQPGSRRNPPSCQPGGQGPGPGHAPSNCGSYGHGRPPWSKRPSVVR